MAPKCTKQKLSSQNLNRGFTLVELLVTTLIASVVLIASLGLITDARKRFVSDQVRSQSNQTLRVGMDLVGTDIKNTGDFLQSDINLPVVTVVDGGSPSLPDQLILQRKLISDTLTVCENVNVGSKSTITVAVRPGNSDCPIYSDGNSDNLTDALSLAMRERCEQDGTAGCSRTTPPATGTCDDECVSAYIYDPVDQEGEFFLYSFEEPDSTTSPTLNRIYVGGTATFVNDYEVANKPIIYLMEKRHYSLNANNELQLSVNDQAALPLVNQVANFKISAKVTTNATAQDAFNSTVSVNDASTYLRSTDWQTLEYLEVDVTSIDPSESELTAIRDTDQLELTSRFYPRNALSQD